MVNFVPLAAEVISLVWGTPANFNGFRVLAALLHGTPAVGVSQTSVLNKGRHLYPARRPSRWASAHILVIICISLSLYYLLRCQYRWHGATYCYSHRPSCVVLSVSLFITVASPEKKAEPVEMPFGVGTQVGPRNNLLGVGQDPPLEWAILRRGVARCKV